MPTMATTSGRIADDEAPSAAAVPFCCDEADEEEEDADEEVEAEFDSGPLLLSTSPMR